MEHTITALRAAKLVADTIPVPYLGEAVAVALSIAELAKVCPVQGWTYTRLCWFVREERLTSHYVLTWQAVKDTRNDCRELAERVAKDTLGIYEQLRSCGTALDGGSASAPVEELLRFGSSLHSSTFIQEAELSCHVFSVLQRIRDRMERRKKKGIWSWVLKRSLISSEVAELTKELDHAIGRFNVKELIHIDHQISVIVGRQLNQDQHIEDSARVGEELIAMTRSISNAVATVQGELQSAAEANKFQLSLRDIELIEKLEDGEGSCTGVGSKARAIVRYRGELRRDGSRSAVIVKRFPTKDDNFMAEVERAKKLWHPNTTHFLGYCPDDSAPFLAYSMACHVGSFEALSRAVRGVEKFLWVMKATKQIQDALLYVASQSSDLQWTPDNDIEPITGGNDLIVTPDERVLLDVSQCKLDRLPNVVVLYEWTISLGSRTRKLIQELKQNPLANVVPHRRRSALCKLWRDFTSFTDFFTDEAVQWTSRRIVCPGECFLLSNKEVLDGLCYEDQLLYHTLTAVYHPAWLRPVTFKESASKKTKTSKGKKVRRKWQRVEGKERVYDIPATDLIHDGPQEYAAKERWRRYTVHDMDYGWCLQTQTRVRENGDCTGWFINQGIRLRDLPLDLGDLSIATGLNFTTQSYLVNMFDQSGRKKPPPTLYFYERVHQYPRASLDIDERLDWPWGYWSSDPDDKLEIERVQDSHRAREHSIAFLGVTEEGTFRWMQIVEDCLMCIDVRVEVEYCKYTPDQCMVLEEIQEAAIVEDMHEPDRWQSEPESDDESALEELWEEEQVQRDGNPKRRYEPESEEDSVRARHDKNRVATGLFWLRVDKKRRGVYSWDEWYRRLLTPIDFWRFVNVRDLITDG
ncbi:hypothetical protein BD414DRAFT_537953 [Trametes punicea]|nr:hypothetical protein BD414DRAFT_537953 [Trametes punicea]